MILLIDNYDSHNPSSIYQNFAEVQVLRNDDPRSLYEEATKADGLVFLLVRLLMLEDGRNDSCFAGKKPILGIWHQAKSQGVFGGRD